MESMRVERCVATPSFDETSTCEICIDRLARKRNDVCSVARKEMFMRQVILVDNASVMFGLFGKLKDFLIPTLRNQQQHKTSSQQRQENEDQIRKEGQLQEKMSQA